MSSPVPGRREPCEHLGWDLFEFRLRILEAGPDSHLGIVEGFPSVLIHANKPGVVEAELVRALIDYLERQMDREATRIDWDDFPTVRLASLLLAPLVG
jgi:hypothetical protein